MQFLSLSEQLTRISQCLFIQVNALFAVLDEFFIVIVAFFFEILHEDCSKNTGKNPDGRVIKS